MLTENTPLLEDPPSPIERHVKWKMARTKQYGQMTSQAAQEKSDRITRYKSRRHKVVLFLMVVTTYSTLSLGDQSIQVVFVQRGQV